jgi:hypothetical protein
VALAREDAAFWEALKAWELKREESEAARQKEPPKPRPEARRDLPILQFKLRELTPEEKAEWERRMEGLTDPVFLNFLARVHRADDEVPKWSIVIRLRTEMRRELNLRRPLRL